MARSGIPSGWDKIRQNVQETERLMGQKQYNQSMIKARQTVEYMVKLQCDQAGIVESSMDAMIRELYNSGWISKSTAEHYLQIYEITARTMQIRLTMYCLRRSTPSRTTESRHGADVRQVPVLSSQEAGILLPSGPAADFSLRIFSNLWFLSFL